MSRKVFVGGLHHESDTFNPIVTSRSDIWVDEGEALLDGKGRSAIRGVIDTLRESGCEPVPGLVARAVPNGEWDQEYYLELKDRLIGALKAALPVDAVCLSLHGSMRIRGLGEAEGPLLEEIRRLCPGVPIVASLDMHATITPAMMRGADAFVGYKCAPHTDTYETGVLAARITARALEEGFTPRMAAVHLPFLIAGEQSETSVSPMRELTGLLRDCEKRPHIMGASYLLGFPWADSGENGVAALVVTDGDEDLARRTALELAHVFWDRRGDFGFYNETREVPDALDQAFQSIERGVWPVVLSDSGDNPTAGSSQDVTNFLKAIVADGRLAALDPPLLYQGFYDPAFCARALEAGKGGIVEGDLGAAFDKKTSRPIHVKGLVRETVASWSGAGGCPLALVDVEGVDVVVTGKHVACYEPEMMRALGAEPEERKCIVVKLGYLEPEIRAIARRSIMVLTDGSTNEIFSRLPYKRLRRPIYPMDKDAGCAFRFIE